MQLPAGAQTWLSCGYDNAWTPTDYLTAAAVDALRGANWQRSGAQSEPPEPIRRPRDIRAEASTGERRVSKAQAFLERQRRRQSTDQEEA